MLGDCRLWGVALPGLSRMGEADAIVRRRVRVITQCERARSRDCGNLLPVVGAMLFPVPKLTNSERRLPESRDLTPHFTDANHCMDSQDHFGGMKALSFAKDASLGTTAGSGCGCKPCCRELPGVCRIAQRCGAGPGREQAINMACEAGNLRIRGDARMRTAR